MKCVRCAPWRKPLAYNFNSGAPPLSHVPQAGAPAVPAAPPADAAGPAPAAPDSPLSAALARFRSCRWMQPAEHGNAGFCAHREVKPYAGCSSFDADAWCPDCQYYKVRRVPKKRTPDDYAY